MMENVDVRLHLKLTITSRCLSVRFVCDQNRKLICERTKGFHNECYMVNDTSHLEINKNKRKKI